MSLLAWLDSDPCQQRAMRDVIDLFREQGTIDDLGLGQVRDAFADQFFPGTSTLQTRLRYVLFAPWLMQRASAKPSPDAMQVEFARTEYRLISSLLAGGEYRGVMGNQSRESLQRLPSSVYWGAVNTWGIVTARSAAAYFRLAHDHRALQPRTAAADDLDAYAVSRPTGIDPHLPPPPARLLTSTDFALTTEEEQYLSDRISAATRGSLMAWLALHEPAAITGYPWQLPNLPDAPIGIQRAVDHARRFHTAIHGAPLLYNLLLAEMTEQDHLIDTYRGEIDAWRAELSTTSALDGWDRHEFWAAVRRQQPKLRPPTHRFVDTWLEIIGATDEIADHPAARELVATRERRLKGARARMTNAAARDRWTGASGLGRLSYRWNVAASHLADLYQARRSQGSAP